MHLATPSLFWNLNPIVYWVWFIVLAISNLMQKGTGITLSNFVLDVYFQQVPILPFCSAKIFVK